LAAEISNHARGIGENVFARRLIMEFEDFNTHRPLLFSIAYRMLGSASDAEDVLQDAWVRYRSADASAIRSPKAFAATIVSRLCLDRLKSAQATRETYVGPWLPEPILTSEVKTPDIVLQNAESVTLAFLVLLEKLSPEERAVFLLKEIFEYEHLEIAEMLGTTADNSRQLFHRAKQRLTSERPRLTGTPASRRAAAERFARAFASGDGSELTSMLRNDVSMWTDGGGKATAARRPLAGRDEVVNFLVGLYRTAQTTGRLPDVSWAIEEVNSEPALVVRLDQHLESIFVVSIDNDVISEIRVIRNPDKLARIDRQMKVITSR
jgi:RNA polymerase sigma-70 factor (ECF subfamily)